MRVNGLNQKFLSFSIAGLQLFFSGYGLNNVVIFFEIHEFPAVISGGKALLIFCFMLINPLNQITGYSTIDYGIVLIGYQVNE